MDNQILQDLQLFGVDENVTAKELKERWRHLSAHTHPDRYKKETPEHQEALTKQTRLNCAKDRLSAYIALRDAEASAKEYAQAEAEREAAEEAAQSEQAPQEPEMESEYIYSNPDLMGMPHIRTYENYTTPKEEKTDEITFTVSRTLAQDVLTMGIFLGSVMSGAFVASVVAALIPGIATTAPVILVVVMLTTMGGVLIKMKDICESKTQKGAIQGKGVAGDAQ